MTEVHPEDLAVVELIRQRCAAAQKQGVHLAPQLFGVLRNRQGRWLAQGSCCGLGAVLHRQRTRTKDSWVALVYLLDRDYYWVRSFALGFDGKPEMENPMCLEACRRGYSAGAQIRHEFLGK